MVEWGRLLSGYRGEILGRRFESCPPRSSKIRSSLERILFLDVNEKSKKCEVRRGVISGLTSSPGVSL